MHLAGGGHSIDQLVFLALTLIVLNGTSLCYLSLQSCAEVLSERPHEDRGSDPKQNVLGRRVAEEIEAVSLIT